MFASECVGDVGAKIISGKSFQMLRAFPKSKCLTITRSRKHKLKAINRIPTKYIR